MAVDLTAELENITNQIDRLKARAAMLTSALGAIQTLAQESDEPIVESPVLSPDEERGFTQKIRTILKLNPIKAFAATDIRDLLFERDPSANPKVLLIHVHNTLKRLFKQDEVSEVQLTNGRAGFRWKQREHIVDLLTAMKQSLAESEAKMDAATLEQMKNREQHFEAEGNTAKASARRAAKREVKD